MCCLWYLRSCVMYRLHWSFKGSPQGNNVSTPCQLSWFCITKGRVWEKRWSVLQVGMKGITASGSSTGKWCGKIVLVKLSPIRTHTHTYTHINIYVCVCITPNIFFFIPLSQEQVFTFWYLMCDIVTSDKDTI